MQECTRVSMQTENLCVPSLKNGLYKPICPNLIGYYHFMHSIYPLPASSPLNSVKLHHLYPSQYFLTLRYLIRFIFKMTNL